MRNPKTVYKTPAPSVLSVRCPICGVSAWDKCRTPSDKFAGVAHGGRWRELVSELYREVLRLRRGAP